MIIDVHYHYMRLPADDERAIDMIKGMLQTGERAGVKKSLDEVMPLYKDYMDDIECDKLVKRMDESGVDITVINVVDNVDIGFDNERILRINEYCAKAAAKHP